MFSTIIMVMKLVAEEKEMGDKARMFGIQTHQERYKNTVHETNAMYYLENFCQAQTMTALCIYFPHSQFCVIPALVLMSTLLQSVDYVNI